MLNKVMLIGNLGKDPEIRYAQSGTPVASFSLATSETYTDKDGTSQKKTEWHNIIFFGRQAELCGKYLAKGSMVYIEGSLQTRSWDDAQGQKRYTTEVRGLRIQFLDRKGTNPSEYAVASPSDNFETFPTDASAIDDVPF